MTAGAAAREEALPSSAKKNKKKKALVSCQGKLDLRPPKHEGLWLWQGERLQVPSGHWRGMQTTISDGDEGEDVSQHVHDVIRLTDKSPDL